MNRTLAIILCALLVATCAAAPKRKKTTASPEQLLEQARTALEQYRFDDAGDIIDSYYSAMRGSTPAPEAALIKQASEVGPAMMESVEQVVVVDSITVDKELFFQSYRLSPQAGRLLPDDAGGSELNSPVYITNNGLLQLRSLEGADCSRELVAERVLADGTLEAPTAIATGDEVEAPAYPFLMPDGLTLYFAAEGEGSLGGYDIFMTRRSSVNDEFLKPQNVGMPYNSPYDDYLLVIDETTGLGWWATDRNHLDDAITIYIFAPAEYRTNYPADDPRLASLAALRSIEQTHTPDAQLPSLQAIFDRLDREAAASASAVTAGYALALPDGRIITSTQQLRNGRSRQLLEEYFDRLAEVDDARARLEQLRLDYARGNRKATAEIQRLEEQLLGAPAQLERLSNEIVRAEGF